MHHITKIREQSLAEQWNSTKTWDVIEEFSYSMITGSMHFPKSFLLALEEANWNLHCLLNRP